jgi:ribosomal protein S18 acetylase RimI-like enzyme
MAEMTADTALALHQNMLWADRRVAHLGARGTAENAGSWLLIDPGVDFPLFNMAIAAGRRSDMPGADAIDFAAAWFRDRGLKQFRLVLREHADAALIDAAEELGMAEASEAMPSMALHPLEALSPVLAPTDLQIVAVGDEKGLKLYTKQFSGADPAWADVIKRIGKAAMSLHGFTLLLGTVDGKPVATSMAVVTGDTLGIYNVGVDPRFRRRGFGEAISRAAIDVGIEAGCVRAGLQASEMGLPLYRRMGFRTVETYLSMSGAARERA